METTASVKEMEIMEQDRDIVEIMRRISQFVVVKFNGGYALVNS